MKATFFNQPWLVQRYPPGTRLVLHGKYEARNRFRVQAHARTAEAATGDDAVAHYPATEGLSSTQILALVREQRRAIGDVIEPLPAVCAGASGSPTAGAPCGRPTSRRARPISRRRVAGSRSTSCCSSSSRCCAAAGADGRAPWPRCSTSRGADRALALRDAAVPADGRSDARAGSGRRRHREWRPDAAAADGGGRVGQDGRRAVRDAARRRARPPGRDDGADRDARRAALRDDPVADGRRARPRGSADRLDARRAGARICWPSSRPASCR